MGRSNETKEKAPGIKDVAKYAGVSISTVSNVLNGAKPVSEPLRQKVLQAVDELGYEVNRVARNLKMGKTNTIAVIVPSITSVFFPPLLKSIQAAAADAGYTVSVFGTFSNIKTEKHYIQSLRAQCIDGILLSSCLDSSAPSSEAYVRELSHLEFNGRPIPLICLESAIGNTLDAVVANDRGGLEEAVSHLLSLGRKRIAYISAPTTISMGKEREKGYLDALRNHNIAVDHSLIVEGDYSPASGYQCMEALLRSRQAIDAVAAGNDQMAIGAMCAMKDAGLKIPEDIAVIGYNNNFPASLVQPSLSTVHVPREEMGQTAFSLFLRRMRDPDASRMLVRLNGELVIRRSTVPSAPTSWDLDNW